MFTPVIKKNVICLNLLLSFQDHRHLTNERPTKYTSIHTMCHVYVYSTGNVKDDVVQGIVKRSDDVRIFQ